MLTRPLFGPTSWYIVALLLFATRNYLMGSAGVNFDKNYLDGILLGFIAACWVSRDLKKNTGWPVDQTMLFYSIAFPIYMVATRKWRGVVWLTLILLGLALASILPALLVESRA